MAASTKVRVPFEAYLGQIFRFNTERVKQFFAKCDNFRALDNCDDIFLSSARLLIASLVQKGLDAAEKNGDSEEDCIDRMIEFYSKERQLKAKWPTRSSSITANLYDQCELAAIAEIIELMQEWKAKG
jgi:hypothetical protein